MNEVLELQLDRLSIYTGGEMKVHVCGTHMRVEDNRPRGKPLGADVYVHILCLFNSGDGVEGRLEN